MSDIKNIINDEQGRNINECRDQQELALEAQERNLALLKALDVVADELKRIADHLTGEYKK